MLVITFYDCVASERKKNTLMLANKNMCHLTEYRLADSKCFVHKFIVYGHVILPVLDIYQMITLNVFIHLRLIDQKPKSCIEYT